MNELSGTIAQSLATEGLTLDGIVNQQTDFQYASPFKIEVDGSSIVVWKNSAGDYYCSDRRDLRHIPKDRCFDLNFMGDPQFDGAGGNHGVMWISSDGKVKVLNQRGEEMTKPFCDTPDGLSIGPWNALFEENTMRATCAKDLVTLWMDDKYYVNLNAHICAADTVIFDKQGFDTEQDALKAARKVFLLQNSELGMTGQLAFLGWKGGLLRHLYLTGAADLKITGNHMVAEPVGTVRTITDEVLSDPPAILKRGDIIESRSGTQRRVESIEDGIISLRTYKKNEPECSEKIDFEKTKAAFGRWVSAIYRLEA